ncbi:hypothetical protein C0991_008714 [Blastosporella zonata]|nr:hypothetical protein C0991_008714 [Blastosporella zonata]
MQSTDIYFLYRSTPHKSEPPRSTLPYLPPELWNLILRHATSSFSDSPRTVSFLSLAHSHCHLHRRLANYRATMRTKADLTLVCKDWHTYAQDVLYESVWISCASEARSLALALTGTGVSAHSGKFIRHLHIETPTLERCDPADLRTILDSAPRLEVYSDYRSVRRNGYNEKSDPRSTPRELLSTLAHPNNSLRRLSWTNYDDVSFHLHMSPMLETTTANLEFLELTFCSTHLQASCSVETLFTPEAITLTFPALRSLKVTLDNDTFAVLATWTMPSLRNISVLSADFSYASSGFSQFFRVHGPKLTQLEFGHSSSTIEEHYLTQPPATNTPQPFSIPLAAWCPNLVEFICSADAEWNWQHPDWIAPHVLLPTHPSLQLIGIRDIDKRLREDDGAQEQRYFGLLEQIGSLLQRDAFPSLRYIRDMSWESDKMRRGVGDVYVTDNGSAMSRFGLLSRMRRQGLDEEEPLVSRETRQVLKFWESVLARCRAAGVWLEDHAGVNVTMRDLRRAEAGKGAVGGGRVEFGEGC